MKIEIAVGDYVHLETWKKGDKLWSEWIEQDDEYKDIIKKLDAKEEILPAGEYHLVIDYPLSRPYRESITFANPVKREEIVEIICNRYRKIYKLEDITSNINPSGIICNRYRKTYKLEDITSNINPRYNRVHTDGEYGIWGHDLSDLNLYTIYVDENKVITLEVDS